MRWLSNRNRAEVDEGDAVSRLLSAARPGPQDLAPERAQLLFDRALVASLRSRRRPRFNSYVLCGTACVIIAVSLLTGKTLWSLRQTRELPHHGEPMVQMARASAPREQPAITQVREVRRPAAGTTSRSFAVRRLSTARANIHVAALDPSSPTYAPIVGSSGARSKQPGRDLRGRVHQPSQLVVVQPSLPAFSLSIREAPAATPGFAQVSTTPIGDNRGSRTTYTVEHTGTRSTKVTIARAVATSISTVLMVETAPCDAGGPNPQEGAKP